MNDESKKIGDWYNWYTGDKLKGGYENERWQKNERTRFDFETTKECIKKYLLPLIPEGAKVLEIGCGAGTWTKLVLNERPDITIDAVDISNEMIVAAKANVNNSLRVNFIVSDWLAFSTDFQYDFLFSIRAFEYFSQKYESLLLMEKVVKPGANVAIISKQPHYWRSLLRLKKWKSMHRLMMSVFKLRKMVSGLGFADVNIYLATIAVPLVSSITFLGKLNKWFNDKKSLMFVMVAESYLITFRKKL
jgi:ubiquinone/menaquinone biosynthesis C-methylase UbiE